jgi:hypothetical protein
LFHGLPEIRPVALEKLGLGTNSLGFNFWVTAQLPLGWFEYLIAKSENVATVLEVQNVM